MPKLDIDSLPLRTGTIYPPPLDAQVRGRSSLRLGDAGGLSQFGVNLVILAPGAQSSIRHWHEKEDEFVWVLSGTVTMRTEAGDEPMGPGDCAAFPAGRADGHCFVNRGEEDARLLVVGSRIPGEVAHYPDLKIRLEPSGGKAVFLNEDGTPWSAP